MQKFYVRSNSEPTKKHLVQEREGKWSCDCVAGQMGKVCAHIRKVQNKLEGNGPRVNEYLVLITRGKAAIEGPLTLGEDVQLLVEGTVVKVEREDNHDGTYNQIAKVRAIVITKQDE